MPARIDFRKEQQVAMLIAYVGGRSFFDIAKAFGCSKNRIRDEMLYLGVKPDRSRSISSKMIGKPSRRLGAKWSDESRKRASEAKKGCAPTRTGPISEQTRARISAATKGKNVKWTPEQKAAIERIRQAVKRFLHRCLKRASLPKADRTSKVLGYSPIDLVNALGPKPAEDCHIDHYVPVAEFIRRGITDPAIINSLHNLRWLPAEQNRKKSDSVPHDADAVLTKCIGGRPVLTAHFSHGSVRYTPGLPS